MNTSIPQARRFLAHRQNQRQIMLNAQYEKAVSDFNTITQMIIKNYHPKYIYQWGSLLDKSRFKEYSDIDIAVDGIDEPESFFQMFGDAEKMTKFSLDLLDINKIAPEFAAIIKSKGIIIYERRS